MIWTAYSRAQKRIVAFHIGDEGPDSAIALYRKVRRCIPAIACLCTDANSCYRLAFDRHGVREPHIESKAETHRIESQNSSIRDNLARFNRRSKRHSKSWTMLEITLDLFFNRHTLPSFSHAT